MTPGQDALIEAMRLEQARIYGQLCPEHAWRAADREAAERALELANANARRARFHVVDGGRKTA